MNDNMLKVLAVADPAVMVYTDKKLDILKNFKYKVQFDVFPWEKYYSTMLDVFNGKAYYDIVMVAGHLWKRDFIEKNYIQPIEFEDEDILPAIAQEMKYNGKAYLSPSFCDGHMIVYRKSMTEKKFDNIITPQEYADFAKNHIIAMKAHPSEIFTDALPFLRMNGQDVYDENYKAVCASEEIVKGLEVYCELKKHSLENTEAFGNGGIAEIIRNKKVTAAVTWSGQLGTVFNESCIEPDDLAFSTFSTAWNVTWAFAVSSSCKNQAEANELLRFLRSPEIDSLAGSLSGAPIRKQSYLNGMKKYPWYECQLEMIENAKPLPDMTSAGDKNGIFYEEISNAFSGKKTPLQAMTDAEARINKI